MTKYVHTNIIARDSAKLIAFYKEVFGCRSIGQQRELKGAWVDAITGIRGAHITGEHLALPGFEENTPTLEIFTYGETIPSAGTAINRCGLAHIAFAVDDVAKTLRALLDAGGGAVGTMETATYPDGRKLDIVYATDPEGNIVEILKWTAAGPKIPLCTGKFRGEA
ncbi:Catechol 2,3-dioxygenase [Sporobacter termitidis DSM 10068]|uniref:Catechol 2,3-dioxygenase n=1 Tax=Sporobacter termitidis DSM 10068 TaxID=1123282 RepID=A0A1M5TX81_9FIRM|nr:VOC family protein [Sporobacter termitidis]SHH55304.1 Catechol 2,3-dioxygenase [Sporobacter termitidis DSM 10068]